jgi:DCN1-like protein 3
VDNAINKLFEEYKDDNDCILSDGIERLCGDLEYKPDQFEVLVLAFCLDAEQMCCFTKKEFIHGLKKINATTIADIKLRISQVIEKLKNEMELFKQLYRWTFRFGLEYGHRILSLDMAIILWRLVYTIHKPEILDRWLSFLENDSNIRGIPKDTWNMFQNFSEQFDISSYNSDDAWPSLFDDFVLEYRNEMAAKFSGMGAEGGTSAGQEATNNNIDLNNFNYSTVNNQVYKL